ncbi:hypothetical protein PFJ87_06g01290 [Encephalitozoon hellem]|uniref:Uncharacterized protein n=1 Tax=Encephalitozoon hellem TaxID=27973 RepID=A0ABY8CL46_ENCHE|nr:hypothetical protein PFJ87_06g01290 [Encephalitozoon hellem]
MDREEFTSIKEKKIFPEILTFVSLFFMTFVQYGEMNHLMVIYATKFLVFTNFFYHVGSSIWRIFTYIQERRSLINGVFSIRNMLEVAMMCFLVLYFRKVVTDPQEGKIDRYVIVVSMGYLLSKVNEVLDYSTIQKHCSKMLFSSVVVLIIGIAFITDFWNDGTEGIYTEIAYVIGVFLSIFELAVEGRVVERSLLRRRSFSIFMALLLICAISFPVICPVMIKWSDLFVGWIKIKIIGLIKPQLIKIKDRVLSLSKEQIKVFVSEYVRKILEEYLPNFKDAVRRKVGAYVPEKISGIPSSVLKWWKSSDVQPPLNEFD